MRRYYLCWNSCLSVRQIVIDSVIHGSTITFVSMRGTHLLSTPLSAVLYLRNDSESQDMSAPGEKRDRRSLGYVL